MPRGNREAPAIFAHGEPALTYADLDNAVSLMREALNGHGFGRGDRIAVALSQTSGCLCGDADHIGCGGAVILIDPAATEAEYRIVLRQIGADALMVSADITDAASAAEKLDIPVLTARTGKRGIGIAGFEGPVVSRAHTAGTT